MGASFRARRGVAVRVEAVGRDGRAVEFVVRNEGRRAVRIDDVGFRRTGRRTLLARFRQDAEPGDQEDLLTWPGADTPDLPVRLAPGSALTVVLSRAELTGAFGDQPRGHLPCAVIDGRSVVGDWTRAALYDYTAARLPRVRSRAVGDV